MSTAKERHSTRPKLRLLPRSARCLLLASLVAGVGCTAELPIDESTPPQLPNVRADGSSVLADVGAPLPDTTATADGTTTDSSADTGAADVPGDSSAGDVMCVADEPNVEATCADGLDNDCDGLIDNADNNCWWNPSFTRRIRLRFNYPAGSPPLSNFPVVVRLNDGRVGGWDTVSEDNIRFIDRDGTSLAHEVEWWNENSSVVAVWVRVPRLDPDDFIYMYYNDPGATSVENPDGVWGAEFRGVWHLEENVSDDQTGDVHEDSTTNGHDGTHAGNDETVRGSSIGRSQDFDGDDFAEIASSGFATTGNAMTISAWVNADDANGWTRPRIVSGGAEGRVVTLRYNDPIDGSPDYWEGTMRLATGEEYFISANGAEFGTWTHIAMTYESPDLKLFINGAERFNQPTAGGDVATIDTNLFLGRRSTLLDNYWHGQIDEVRLEHVARDENWLSACYDNALGQFVIFDPYESF